MARRDVGSGYGARWVAVAAVGVLTIIVLVLVILALQHADPDIEPGEAAPAPTFTLGVQTETPTPTDEPPPPPAFDLASERLLTIGTVAWWRATAGVCGGAAPVVERSTDQGATWNPVTPAAARVVWLDATTASDADLVVGNAECQAEFLRSFTQGADWAPNAEQLGAARFVDPADAAAVHLGGETVAAPCATAHGLHATGDVVALICDGGAYSWRDGQWIALGTTGSIALATTGDTVLVAHASDSCAGIALTSFAGADPAAPTEVGCMEGMDAAAPAALSSSANGWVLWSGDQFLAVP